MPLHTLPSYHSERRINNISVAALTSHFKELSASTKFRLVCIKKESLNRTRKSFEEIVVSNSLLLEG